MQIPASVEARSFPSDGEVQIAASVGVKQQGRVQIVSQVQVTFGVPGQVQFAASVEAGFQAQVQFASSMEVLLPASILPGEVQFDASVETKLGGQVQAVASMGVVFSFTGEVQFAASVQADFRVGLADLHAKSQDVYIPNEGRFVTRGGRLFIVDTETLHAQGLPNEGLGWQIDLSPSPGVVRVFDDGGANPRQQATGLQYRLDRVGGQFDMGVLRIEIPDDWHKS